MSAGFAGIIERLPGYRERCGGLSEMLLTNLVMVGEIPSPTFGEADRVAFLQRRFSECGLQNCSTDEVGNGLAIIPGSQTKARDILVVAHADTIYSEKHDHTISLQADRVTGTGVADNSLGLAVLTTLPTILERLELTFKSSLILMGASRSLGRGNLEGLRFFLGNAERPIQAGVCVEGVPLGRLSIASIGMLRGEITCSVSEQYDWTRFGTTNAILTLNEVINRILEIPLPRRPQTSIVLGTIEGGKSFNTIATHARLCFEIRSESAEISRQIAERMEDITAEMASRTGSDVGLDLFASRQPGGLTFAHPLARHTREIMKSLDINIRVAPSTSELSAFIDEQIPAVTVGISTGERLNEPDEVVYIKPMFTGLAQLLGILLAIDGGHCDED